MSLNSPHGYVLEIIEEASKLVKIKITCTDRGKEPMNNSPILDFCRSLLKKGFKYSTRLEIYRDGSEPDVICPKIGLAAKYAVIENDKEKPTSQPVFCKYRPFPGVGALKKQCD